MSKTISLFLLIGFCCLVMVTAQAATIIVPTNFSSLSTAIASAAANDTINIIAAGPYDEVFTISTPLVIQGIGVRPNICIKLNPASPSLANDGFTITGFSGNVVLRNLNLIPSRTNTPTDD